MNEFNLEDAIRQHVAQPNYQPVKPKVLAKQLGLRHQKWHRELKASLKKLVRQGVVSYGPGHLIEAGPAAGSPADSHQADSPESSHAREAAEPDLPEATAAAAGDGRSKKRGGEPSVVGVFRRAAAGFGFVRPTGTARERGRSDDIYISKRKTADASSGDVVRVRLRKSRSGDQRVRGEIVEVVERETRQFVGTYSERAGVGYVQVDGSVFAHPVPVGDPGAKNAQPGDKVVVEMVRFPAHMYEGEAVITELLGARGAPGVDTLTVMREFNLPDQFSDEVLEDARRQARAFDESVGPDRLDLTETTIITIDPVDARDFDDAISLTRTKNGHWRLGVHIADVSHFVPPKSILDQEARERATSVYLPDRVIPMLPEVISNNLASLQPDRVRYAKTAFLEFTPEGVPVHTELHNSVIRSKRRFTYEEVDEFLADRRPWRKKLTPDVFELLEQMHELAMRLRRRRLDGGAIELTLPEIKLELDKQGRVAGARVVENTESHQIIEEFMLAANEAVARWLDDQELYFLRRAHGAPDPRKLKLLTEFVRELGIECESLESRFEIKRVVAEVRDRPEQHAVNYAILRSMQKAVYSPEEEGHYALNSDNYCHFTSPIRRYPDLTVHRMVDQLVRAQRPVTDYDALLNLGDHCSEREQRAEAAERELIKIKLLNYLSSKVGEQLEAVITGVEEFGLFAQGTKLPAEGLIHISSMQDDYYHYDSATHTLAGHRTGNQYRLGDVVLVDIAHVDVDRRQLDFRLVKRVAKAGGRRPEAGKKAGGRRPEAGKKGGGRRPEAGKKDGRSPEAGEKARGKAAGRPGKKKRGGG